MLRRNAKRLLILASVVVLAAACESGTGPEDKAVFDADAVLADFEALDLILHSDAMDGFRAMGAGLSFQGAAPAEAFALKVGGELLAPIISQFRRGKTFVYDPGLGHYVVDDELTGAPETGVRFLLYSAGPDGKPDATNQIGHSDLIDEGYGSVEDIALRLDVVEAGETVLDYRTTLDVLENGGEITVAGFLQGEDDRLNFDIEVSGSEGSGANTIDVGFDIWLQGQPFAIEGTVSGMESESGEGGHITLLVTHGDDSFSVDVEGNDASIDGTVKVNGGNFAFITGDPDEPTITNVDGEPLTWQEMLVLRQILDSTEDVFDFWEDLMDPIDELVILALIL